MVSLKIFFLLFLALTCTLATPTDQERTKKDVLLGTYGGYAYPYAYSAYAAPLAYSSYYPATYSALPYAAYSAVLY